MKIASEAKARDGRDRAAGGTVERDDAQVFIAGDFRQWKDMMIPKLSQRL